MRKDVIIDTGVLVAYLNRRERSMSIIEGGESSENPEQSTETEKHRIILIAELEQLGVKCTPEKILRIEKLSSGKIIFLEEGKDGKRGSGFKHILEQHKADFANIGITSDQIPDFLIIALSQGKIVGYQGTKEPRREIYEVIFKEKNYYIAISIGDNGYIVGANPVSYP